jgi:hypothetical protein
MRSGVYLFAVASSPFFVRMPSARPALAVVSPALVDKCVLHLSLRYVTLPPPFLKLLLSSTPLPEGHHCGVHRQVLLSHLLFPSNLLLGPSLPLGW